MADREAEERRVRVMGIDPGLTRCGVGVVDVHPGRRLELVAVDVLRTPVDEPLELRLLGLADALDGWLARMAPDLLAVERVFAQHNVRTVMGTAQAAGLAVVAAARRGVPVAVHTPSEVKAAVTGSGRAGKEQVTTMVTRILRLASAPRPADAADALALAICSGWRGALSPDGAGLATSGGSGRDGRDVPGTTEAQRRWQEALRSSARSARRGGTVPTSR